MLTADDIGTMSKTDSAPLLYADLQIDMPLPIRWKDRRDRDEPGITPINTDAHGLSVAQLRVEILDDRCMKSKQLTCLLLFPALKLPPRSDRVEPNLLKPRKLMEDPILTLFKILDSQPGREKRRIETVDPIMA